MEDVVGAFGFQKDGVVKCTITDCYGEPVELGLDMCIMLLMRDRQALCDMFDDIDIVESCAIIPSHYMDLLDESIIDFPSGDNITWGQAYNIVSPIVMIDTDVYAMIKKCKMTDVGVYEYGFIINLDTNQLDFYYNSALIGSADFDTIINYEFKYIVVTETGVKIYSKESKVDFIYTPNAISNRQLHEAIELEFDV